MWTVITMVINKPNDKSTKTIDKYRCNVHKSIITDHIYVSISITINKSCHIPYHKLIP